jgi:SP family general alpha glucoside:H+ symporter-like MFS transporter
VGEIIGLFINGWVSERFGYRYTVMSCLVLIIGFTAIFFTAQSVIALQVAEILCGIVSGIPVRICFLLKLTLCAAVGSISNA